MIIFKIISIFSSFPERLLSTAGCRGYFFISPLQKLQNCVPIGQRRHDCGGTYRWAGRGWKSTYESEGPGWSDKKRGRTVPRVSNTSCGVFGLMKRKWKKKTKQNLVFGLSNTFFVFKKDCNLQFSTNQVFIFFNHLYWYHISKIISLSHDLELWNSGSSLRHPFTMLI